MKLSLVGRLLRGNISIVQFAGYAFASLVGLAIVLAAVQFYRDASGVFGSNGTINSRDYMVLSKQIALGNSSTQFTEEEIADLRAQPWVDDVGAFTASRFKASIGLDFAGKGLSTESFFESLPAEFFDEVPPDWHFDASVGESADVPIILSRDYLALYNFGFAATRGLPTMRESDISMIPLTISLRDVYGNRTLMRGHIAGFSSRINTIAVPEEFMDWANTHFAPDTETPMPSRLVVETNSPGDPSIKQYLRLHSLDISGDKIDNSAAAYMLRLVTGIVVGIGSVICVLAFFILLLCMMLLLQKNREKLHQLMLLGYSPTQVSKPYIGLILSVNAGVLLFGCVACAITAAYWRAPLMAVGASAASFLPTFATGLALVAVICAVSVASVRHRIRRDF